MRCMKNYFTYPWAILYGFYLYIIFHALFLFRFGRINTSVSVNDLFILLVGILSVVLLMYFGNKIGEKRQLLFIPFVIAVPFSYVGVLGGGLLGPVGMVLFGMIPFLITLPVGYFFLKGRGSEEKVDSTGERDRVGSMR